MYRKIWIGEIKHIGQFEQLQANKKEEPSFLVHSRFMKNFKWGLLCSMPQTRTQLHVHVAVWLVYPTLHKLSWLVQQTNKGTGHSQKHLHISLSFPLHIHVGRINICSALIKNFDLFWNWKTQLPGSGTGHPIPELGNHTFQIENFHLVNKHFSRTELANSKKLHNRFTGKHFI